MNKGQYETYCRTSSVDPGKPTLKQIIGLIESLRRVARAAADFNNGFYRYKIREALDAVPQWALEENDGNENNMPISSTIL